MNKKIFIMFILIIFSISVTYLHIKIFSTFSEEIILEEFYYIPILFGAFFYSIKGAIISYVIVSILYMPFIFMADQMTPLLLADRLLHLLFTGIFAFLAGLLINRDRKLQKQIERDKYLKNIGQVATTIVHDLKNPLYSNIRLCETHF